MKRIILVALLSLIFTSFISLNAQWARTYGGSSGERVYSIQQTSDGRYIVAGYTYSFGASERDIWVLKLSSGGGDIEWQRFYSGGSSNDWACSIQQTNDGGYIVVGFSNSFGAGKSDIWLLKLSSIGDIEWQRTYGGSDSDRANSIQQTSDGGYIVAGDATSFGAGGYDGCVLKLDSIGDIEWQRTYGGGDWDYARSIQQTSDGGYIVVGFTLSFGAGSNDILLLKLSSIGDIEWQRTYGGSGSDSAHSIQQTGDGGYIVASNTNSPGIGEADILILKLNSDGDIDPSCGFIGNPNAIITDTYVSPEDTYITPQNTYVTPLDTSISPIDTDATVILICGVQEHTLTISTNTGGTTNPAPRTYIHDTDTEVSITAIPDEHYRFKDWTGDVLSGHETDNPITITMDSDKSITANFIRQYTLAITAETGGTTDSEPGSYTYDSGDQVTIKAIPESGYRFSEWTGNVPSGQQMENPITITMDSNKSIKANFSAIPKTEDDSEEKKGPCFIATAAYGSPLNPNVRILRDFRDKYLIPNKLGRNLVDLYYNYSPFMADLIAKHKVLKVAVRISLLPLVALSYSMVHFGPIFTAIILVFVFMLPIFLISFFLRRSS